MNPITPTTPGSQNRNGHNPFAQANLSPASIRPTSSKRAHESDDEADENGGDNSPTGGGAKQMKQPAIKRACNECRQQKLRCDVQQDPFVQCSRCRKHRLSCLIEPNFKRVGKRSRHAEMEKEIAELRHRVSQMSGQQQQTLHPSAASTPFQSSSLPQSESFPAFQEEEQYSGSHQAAVASLLELRGNSPSGVSLVGLGDNILAPDRARELFQVFFDHYHPFLPFLDPQQTPEQYLDESRLLFWTIIFVATRKLDRNLSPQYEKLQKPLTGLLWKTITEVPQDRHVVKALCLLCTWTLPTSKTSTDQTFMLSGLMMQIAMQIGLHHPSHAEDFSRYKVQLDREDINDRVRTWAVCNIVAQSVSTGYGQPPSTLYNSTLAFRLNSGDYLNVVNPQLFARLRIEMAADRVSRHIYGNHTGNEEKVAFTDPTDPRAVSFAMIEVERLKRERQLIEKDFTGIEDLYHKAVVLHLQLYSFFDTTSDPALRTDLLELYYAAKDLIDQAAGLEDAQQLAYAPNIIFQMLLAAGFALLKLLNSDYAVRYIGKDGRKYLTLAVRLARTFQTKDNDLPARLCEVLAQLWKESGTGMSNPSKSSSPLAAVHTPLQRQASYDVAEDGVRLKVRSRMSMSVVFDSVWRWRETHTSDRLDNATLQNNPTNPDSSSNSTPPPGALPAMIDSKPSTELLDTGLGNLVGVTSGGPNAAATLNMPLGVMTGLGTTSANSYEFFDPVSWMLDFDPPGGWNNTAFAGYGDFN